MELHKLFPYQYVGGGYFRKKNIPKGQTAKILHGEQAIKYIYDKIMIEIKKEKE